MDKKTLLIVDDEKNIRFTLVQTLESLDITTDTAINGEEALQKVKTEHYDIILLDLKMPGMDGMEVLRQVVKIRPDIHVIIITAHGTIEYAVEAMRLGAVDFIQKPFTPNEIRDLISQVMDREKLDEMKAADYKSHFELAKRCIHEHHLDASIEHAKKAIALDSARPEAFNLLGALYEIQGKKNEAQKNYRAALALDPGYKPAIENLERSASWKESGEIDIGKIS